VAVVAPRAVASAPARRSSRACESSSLSRSPAARKALSEPARKPRSARARCSSFGAVARGRGSTVLFGDAMCCAHRTFDDRRHGPDCRQSSGHAIDRTASAHARQCSDSLRFRGTGRLRVAPESRSYERPAQRMTERVRRGAARRYSARQRVVSGWMLGRAWHNPWVTAYLPEKRTWRYRQGRKWSASGLRPEGSPHSHSHGMG